MKHMNMLFMCYRQLIQRKYALHSLCCGIMRVHENVMMVMRKAGKRKSCNFLGVAYTVFNK